MVLAGATLFLNAPAPNQGLKLRMESGPESFVSVVTMGGSLAIGGAKEFHRNRHQLGIAPRVRRTP